MNIVTLNKTFDLAKRIFDFKTTTEPIIPHFAQKAGFQYSDPESPLPTCTPEEENVSSYYISEFLKELKNDKTLDMHNIIILRHGRVICRASYGYQDINVWKTTFSACKSITALAIGLLVDDGLLSPDDKISKIFENKMPSLAFITLKDLTVKHLLTMTSGIVFNEAACMTEKEWIKSYLNSIVVGDMGKTFNYNSLNTYMLSAIVNKLTGKGLYEFLRERIFAPLKITNVFWEKSPEGIEKGGWGMYILPDDLAKLGQLVMQNGVWDGKQLISEKWITESTTAQVAAPKSYGNYNYGYQTWVGRYDNTFLFNGMLGQNVLGFRDSQILIVSNAGNDEMFQQSNYFPIVNKYFGKPFDVELEPDESAVATLRKTISSLSFYPNMKKRTFRDLFVKKTVTLPSECSEIQGKTWTATDDTAAAAGLLPVLLQVMTNNYTKGLKSISFQFTENTCVMIFEENDETYTVPIGLSSPARSTITFHGEPYELASEASFAYDEDGYLVLKANIAFIETPCTRKIRIYFKDDHVLYRSVETPGVGFVMQLFTQIKQSALNNRLLHPFIVKMDEDYINYKIIKTFEPTIKLTCLD